MPLCVSLISGKATGAVGTGEDESEECTALILLYAVDSNASCTCATTLGGKGM